MQRKITEKLKQLKSSKYVTDIAWQMSGNTGAQIIGIAIMPIITRIYSPNDFAALTLFTQIVAALSILITLRYEYLIILPKKLEVSKSVFSLTLILGALHATWMTPTIFYLSNKAEKFTALGEINDWLWISPISATLVSISIALQQAIQKDGNFKSTAMAEFAGRVTYAVWTTTGSLALPSIAGLMTSIAASTLTKVILLLNIKYTIRSVKNSTLSLQIPLSIHRLAISTSISNLISMASGIVPMLFIAKQYDTNLLGQYGLVVSTLYLPTLLIGHSIGQVYYQRASELKSTGLSFNNIFIQTSKHLAIASFAIYITIFSLSPILYKTIFGIEWTEAGEMARWIAISAAFGLISTPLDRTSMIVNAWWYLTTWHTTRTTLICSCVVIAHNHQVNITTFVVLITAVNAIMYAVDWLASYYFSHMNHRNDTDKVYKAS
jgi:O-antigen/teichoic acid export membrane protein